MKNINTFNQFVNEKAYRMTGVYASKGLIGKVMQAFKQEIAKVKYEGDVPGTLIEVNKEWKKFQKDAEKIILDGVEKGAGDMNSVLFITANLGEEWKADEINGLNNADGSGDLYISYAAWNEMVINVGFMDDANGKKLGRKIDKTGMMNAPVANKKDVIYGDYDTQVGNNNLELRDSEYISIDAK
tara:strand:+ start:2497 stop:3051 length:555 start_codon:yes stop_codon:yes gene_type:complete